MNLGEELRKALKPTVSTESDNTDSMSGTGSTDPALTPVVPELPGTGDATQQLPVVDANAELIASLAPPALEDESPVTHDELMKHEVQDEIVHQSIFSEIDAIQNQLTVNNQVQDIIAEVATMEGLVDSDLVFHNVALKSYAAKMGMESVALTLEGGKVSKASLEGIGTWFQNIVAKIAGLKATHDQNAELSKLRNSKAQDALLQRIGFIRKLALKYDGSNTTPVACADAAILSALVVKDGITKDPVKDLQALQSLLDVTLDLERAFADVVGSLGEAMAKATEVNDAVVTSIAKDAQKALGKSPYDQLTKSAYMGGVAFTPVTYKPTMKVAQWAVPVVEYLEGETVEPAWSDKKKVLADNKVIPRLDKATVLQLCEAIEKSSVEFTAKKLVAYGKSATAFDVYDDASHRFLNISNSSGTQPLATDLIPVFNGIVIGAYNAGEASYRTSLTLTGQVRLTQAALLWWCEESVKL